MSNTPPNTPKPFQKGGPKIPGSGVQKGQKMGKTIAKENAWANMQQELAILSKQYEGMTPEEIMGGMGFNPIVRAVYEVMSPHTTEATRFKYTEMLAKKVYGDMSTVKTEGEVINRLEIVLSNGQEATMFDHFNQHAQITDATVVDATPTVSVENTETVEVNDTVDDDSDT